MSRMVRENETSGLRERLFFARSLLTTLRSDTAAPVGARLALRGGVLFHLYSVLVGIAREAARHHQIPGHQDLISLAAVEKAFADAGQSAPEIKLLAQARASHADMICWLDREVRTAMGAAGLARRAAAEPHDGLVIRAEDPYAPLAPGDLERLAVAAERVESLIEQCQLYREEW